jgi:two-component system, OmpR family, sensor histidine kinase BaeS
VRDSLLWRLLGAQLIVIAIAVAISGVLITNLASHSFMQIMLRYHIDPATVEKEFQATAHGVLLGSSLIAAAAAMFLGWVLVRRLVRPLAEMMVLAERIAEGDYARRVETRGSDEMSRLADSLNRMAAALQRIEALRRDLVANVAHELRTPLSTLQGYLEALRDGITPATRETLESLHEEVLRLVRLVNALHQLSQFDARVSHLRRDAVDLAALVHRVVTLYGPETTRRGMTVREVRDPHLPQVDADTDLLSQALRNLLDNALRYAPEGSVITVETALRGGALRVAVRDTGEGIAPEDLLHIFERFYRGEKSRSRETGGAGIGLALVQEIARAHGGDVGAASSPGATTVWFSLPVRIGDTRTATSLRASSPSDRHEGWGRHRT